MRPAELMYIKEWATVQVEFYESHAKSNSALLSLMKADYRAAKIVLKLLEERS